MQSIPVTPILVSIFKDALADSYNFINNCENELKSYTSGSGVHSILLEGIEHRKQEIAVLKDLIERYGKE